MVALCNLYPGVTQGCTFFRYYEPEGVLDSSATTC